MRVTKGLREFGKVVDNSPAATNELIINNDGEMAVEPTSDGRITIDEGDLKPITRTGGRNSSFFSGDSGDNGALGGG